MSHMADFRYYDLQTRQFSNHIDLLFPGWESSAEMVVILAPHDDDGILGPGYLIRAVLANEGRVAVIIFHDGSAGYSDPAIKDSIVQQRQEETIQAFTQLGVESSMVYRLEYPDFSGIHHLGWQLPAGILGAFRPLITRLRALRTTRLVFANDFREHIDHTAVALAGFFDGPQVGDPVVVDWGSPSEIKTFLQYSVWAQFNPLDAQLTGRDLRVRANWAIVVPEATELLLQQALRCWASQQVIIEGILANRRERLLPGDPARYMELFLAVDPRPKLDYGPYKRLIGDIEAGAKD